MENNHCPRKGISVAAIHRRYSHGAERVFGNTARQKAAIMPKPTAREAFNANIADALSLVQLAQILQNTRRRRVRKERRQSIGNALGIPKRDHDDIYGVESADVFLVLKPGAKVKREDFDSHPALLRQAVVAACAALETYLSDVTENRVREIMRRREPWPKSLQNVPMDLAQWKDVEAYTQRSTGITNVVIVPYLRVESSTADNKVGLLLSICGIKNPLKKLDSHRHVAGGTTQAQLKGMTLRRNKIAHEGDRAGHGRAEIEPQDVSEMLEQIQEITEAMEGLIVELGSEHSPSEDLIE